MNTQIVNETMENKMENIFKNIYELHKFKTFFEKELSELDIYCELSYCRFFLEVSIKTKETIKNLYSDIDDIGEYLFDNTDNIEEGKYLKYMNSIKEIRDKLKSDNDERYIQINIMVANYSMKKLEDIIDDIAEDDIEKAKEVYENTKVKFNKLHNLIAMTKEEMPIMTLKDFYEEYVNFLSYLPIEFYYNDGQRTVKDLDDEIPYSTIVNNSNNE